MAYEVFISHSSKDKKTADIICGYLESKKVRCWVAPRDLSPGEDWASGIVRGLEQCSAMVLVFSENSNLSSQVGREVERAAAKEITIFPFRIDQTMPSKSMEYFISNTHWLDAISEPIELHLGKLYKSIRSQLDLKEKGTTAEEEPAELAVEPNSMPTKLWHNYIVPAGESFMAFSTALKMLFGGIAAIMLLLIWIFISVKPPSQKDIGESMKEGMEEARKMSAEISKQYETEREIRAALNKLKSWGIQKASSGTIDSNWWKSQISAFDKSLKDAQAMPAASAGGAVADLEAQQKLLDQWAAAWQVLQPKVREATIRIGVNKAFAAKGRPAGDFKGSEAQLVAAQKAIDRGDLKAAVEKIMATPLVKAPMSYPFEMLMVNQLSYEYGGRPVTTPISPAQVTDFASDFLDALVLDKRGLRLGMTVEEVRTWARNQGAIWMGKGNFISAWGDSNAVSMRFLCPIERGSLVTEKVYLRFTPYFSDAMPSVLYEADVSLYLSSRDSLKASDLIDERFGDPVRLTGGRRIYSGSGLSSIKKHHRHVPSTVVTMRGTGYEINMESNQLQALGNELWKKLVATTKTTAELPENPATRSGDPTPDEMEFRDHGMKLKLGMSFADAAGAEANGGHAFDRDRYRGKYSIPKGTGQVTIFEDDKNPDRVMRFYADWIPTEVTPVSDVLKTYLRRYGAPSDFKISGSTISLNYKSPDSTSTWEIRISSKDGFCEKVNSQARTFGVSRGGFGG